MKYAVVYSSLTGNTKVLADAVTEILPKGDVIYSGPPDAAAVKADVIFVGFWTDKGQCDEKTREFLKTVSFKKIFLFGTAGFGADQSYFRKILFKVMNRFSDSNVLIGSFMCQGKMPASVRERYVKMLAEKPEDKQAQMLIDNFDTALTHPDKRDIDNLKARIKEIL